MELEAINLPIRAVIDKLEYLYSRDFLFFMSCYTPDHRQNHDTSRFKATLSKQSTFVFDIIVVKFYRNIFWIPIFCKSMNVKNRFLQVKLQSRSTSSP